MNTTEVYALIDCNQFYVSCERAFAPYLERKPVGVLSNNDGCLVALSTELKNMGIHRGMPAFQVKKIVGNQNVYLFSSNYELYNDMSSRVMRIISSFANEIEIYSIDEAFLLFNTIENKDMFNFTKAIKEKVKKETSIPISVGLAKTKTLAKLANSIAKRKTEGIFELQDKEQINNILKKTFIENIWGIGRRYTKHLNKIGIFTAYDFVNVSSYLIRKEMGVMGERTQLELKGIPCNELEINPPTTKSIVCSRSFGRPVSSLNDVLESISLFTSKAVRNLRNKGLVAKNLTVFISTNPFKDTRQYANFIQDNLTDYSAYTPDFINLSAVLLKKIFKDDYLYKKTGVMLTDIKKQEYLYPNLFSSGYGNDKKQNLMQAIDSINDKFGNDKVFFASNGIKQTWQMKREILTPRYTTRWDEILTTSSAQFR